MSEKQLHLAKGLDVPRSIAARTVFVAGTKGSGKTYGAGVMAEELLAAGVHVAILDPLGVWYGLRHDAAGGPGGFPIVILGGEHADVPLLPTGGEAVGEFIVRSGQSCIIDMSGFDSDAEQDRFVEALLVKLFRMKSTDKSALHLIMDEADMFVPEQPMKGQERLVGAGKRIVTKGRSRGLSMTMITQRPQSIKKACIEESDVVLCYRIQGINAAKAMKAASQRIFDAIIHGGGEDVTIEVIGEVTEIDPSGGHFSNSIGPLGTLGLIERRAGVVHPTELMFPCSLIGA